jgi:hypothetical protein
MSQSALVLEGLVSFVARKLESASALIATGAPAGVGRNRRAKVNEGETLGQRQGKEPRFCNKRGIGERWQHRRRNRIKRMTVVRVCFHFTAMEVCG